MTSEQRRKEKLTMYLETEQLEALRAICKETRVPLSVYIREGVDYVLKRHAKGDSHVCAS